MIHVSGCIIDSFCKPAAAAVYICTPAAPKNKLQPSYSSRLHNSSVCLQTWCTGTDGHTLTHTHTTLTAMTTATHCQRIAETQVSNSGAQKGIQQQLWGFSICCSACYSQNLDFTQKNCACAQFQFIQMNLFLTFLSDRNVYFEWNAEVVGILCVIVCVSAGVGCRTDFCHKCSAFPLLKFRGSSSHNALCLTVEV